MTRDGVNEQREWPGLTVQRGTEATGQDLTHPSGQLPRQGQEITLIVGLRNWNDVELLMRELPSGNPHRIEVQGGFRTLVDVYEAAKEFEADVVLLDPHLPGFSEKGLGQDAIRELWHYERKPIITVAAVLAGSDYAGTMYEIGAKAHINTPLDSVQVSRLVGMIPGLIKEAYMERASPTYIPQLSAETARVIDHGGWQRRTITVWSPKGGVGKTFIAVNIACALGVIANKPTILLDADMNQGNIHVQMNLRKRVEETGDNIFGLANAYAAKGHMSASMVAAKLVPYRGKLQVLAGIPVMTLGGERVLTGAHGEAFMKDLLETLEGISDFRVIDLGQSYHHAVHVTALEKADLNLIIVNSEAASIHDVYKSLPPLKEILDIDPERFKLVFNKFNEAHGISRKEAIQLLELPQFGYIPTDHNEEVTISINRAEPLVLQPRRSPVSDALIDVTSTFYSPIRDIWEARGKFMVTGRKGNILQRAWKALRV